MKKYLVRYVKTDHYLVTIEAENEDEALEMAEQAIETSNMKLVDLNEGDIEFNNLELVP